MSGYRPGPRFGFLGVLVGLLIVGIVAVAAYNVGLSAGAGAAGAAAAPVVYHPWGRGIAEGRPAGQTDGEPESAPLSQGALDPNRAAH